MYIPTCGDASFRGVFWVQIGCSWVQMIHSEWGDQLIHFLSGTLLLALQDVCAQNPSRIAQALRKYLAAGYAEKGMALLARLDADVPGLLFLGDLVTRTAAAQEGTLNMDQALRQVMESLQQEMKTASREQLQQIPSRLILMAFPALLMPALFLLVFPLAARLIASLQGMTWGSGF